MSCNSEVEILKIMCNYLLFVVHSAACLFIMDHIHDEVLRKNCKFLKEHLQIQILVDLMVSRKVFSQKMANDICSKEGREEQVSEFLGKLRRRGPRAFDVFMECLYESSQTTVIERLEHSLGLDHVDQVH